MKRKLFILFVLLASAVGMKAQEAYAVLSEDLKTLTFYYDNEKDSREGIRYNIDYRIRWKKFKSTIETVIFDPSFAGARPKTTRQWFSEMGITTILGIQYLNTKDVLDMEEMFYKCSSIRSLDLSYFDTQNVKDMSSMFRGCTGLTSLDVSNFNTQNVSDMSNMFASCHRLKSLDLSKFNTQNVANMSLMFSGCEALTSIDVRGFNTQNVSDMSYMFEGCKALTSIDVKDFNTQNVSDMSYMFEGCKALTSLDLSKFNTQNVSDMSYMFRNCSSLMNLDVSNFNTQNVTNMSFLFSRCSSLSNLDVSSFDTRNVTDMSFLFSFCSSLSNLDVSSFDTRNVTDMCALFQGCSLLTSIDVNNFDTKNVMRMDGIFHNCSLLKELDLKNFNTLNVTDMSGMFEGCSSLISLDISNFNTENVIQMWRMFNGCSSLISLDLRNFDTRNVVTTNGMSGMFNSCSSLTSLSISSSLGTTINNQVTDICEGIGSIERPCNVNKPNDFNFDVDTSGDYFVWKGGYFQFEKSQTEIIPVTTDFGYITYCSDKALDFTNVEGMKAYIVVGYDGKVVKLSRIGIVPPETGLLLKADAGEYEVPYTEEDNYVMNMLIGVLEETTLSPTEGNMTNLVLANGKNGLGFYCLKGSGTIAAHRAYLQVPTRLIGNGAKFISMEFDDEVTAISGITTQEEAAPYYDLQGIRHEGKPSKQGIYIMNGKKVVVKD